MKQIKGIVYTVTNNKTNEVVYVGITTKSVESRKRDHLKKSKSKSKCYAFQQAIATLGIDEFKWESDNTLLAKDELAQKEKDLIAVYKQKGFNLLNKDSGGGISKTVYKYKIKDGSLIAKFDCLYAAAKTVNSTKQHISKACLSNSNKFKGFLWSYKFKVPFNESTDARTKKVIQCSLLSGIKIKTFNSVANASRKTGINKTSIAKVCRGERKSCGGYLWKFK
jgi:group I intron endonuclease